MTICIEEYANDIKSAVSHIAKHPASFDEVVSEGYDEQVAEWIIGDPLEANDEAVEIYYAIRDAAKSEFKVQLLGVY